MESYNIFLTVMLLSLVCESTAYLSKKKIICYFQSWAMYRPGDGNFVVEDIDANLCTNIIYAFVGLNSDATLEVLDPWCDLPDNYGKNSYGRIVDLKNSNPELKVSISLGGWNEGSVVFSDVIKDSNLRSQLVQNVLDFLNKYNFDGIDIDWEYPNQRGGIPDDVDNFVLFLQELYPVMKNNLKLVSVVVAATESSASLSYHISQMFDYLDFINILTYDLNGSWNGYLGLNAPLYGNLKDSDLQKQLNVDACITYWLSQKAVSSKIMLGLAFYGRSFTLSSSTQTHIYDPSSGDGLPGPYTNEPGLLAYNEITETLVGYDNVLSITLKAKYVIQKELGGVAVWSVDLDKFHDSNWKQFPLLRAVNNVFDTNKI